MQNVLILVVLFIVGTAIAAVVTASTSTPPFLNAEGGFVEGSIAEERTINLGGWDQYVLLRGRDRAAPILVFLHGGPGSSEMPLFRVYNHDLEDDFLTVNWDQRGTGKSYSSNLDEDTLSLDRMTRDLDELINILRTEFGKDKVVLLGHSWGTLLGLEYVKRHPEKVLAYLGVGQVSDMSASEAEGYNWALDEARSLGDEKAVNELEEIGPPPYSHEAMLRQRKYIREYGGSFHEARSLFDLIRTALRASEVSWLDFFSFIRGEEISLKVLWPKILAVNAAEEYSHPNVPVYFLIGRHDRQVSASLAADYFQALEAPQKELIWFEKSAHSPPFEEPDKFNREVSRIARELGILEIGS